MKSAAYVTCVVVALTTFLLATWELWTEGSTHGTHAEQPSAAAVVAATAANQPDPILPPSPSLESELPARLALAPASPSKRSHDAVARALAAEHARQSDLQHARRMLAAMSRVEVKALHLTHGATADLQQLLEPVERDLIATRVQLWETLELRQDEKFKAGSYLPSGTRTDSQVLSSTYRGLAGRGLVRVTITEGEYQDIDTLWGKVCSLLDQQGEIVRRFQVPPSDK